MRYLALTRFAAPVTEPVTLDTAKLYLRIDHTQEDSLITSLIKTARTVAEEHMRRALITQSWRVSLGAASACRLVLPRGPVREITQMAFVSSSGDQTILGNSGYEFLPGQDAVRLKRSSNGARLEIEYNAGYGGMEDVPDSIRQGILMHVAALYEQREGPSMPDAIAALYAPYREVRI